MQDTEKWSEGRGQKGEKKVQRWGGRGWGLGARGASYFERVHNLEDSVKKRKDKMEKETERPPHPMHRML